jgi:hypothetical protein
VECLQTRWIVKNQIVCTNQWNSPMRSSRLFGVVLVFWMVSIKDFHLVWLTTGVAGRHVWLDNYDHPDDEGSS